MKVSIVTAILNSHEVVRRQLLHYKNMPLPKDVELIFVDDGSEPPLTYTIGDTPYSFIMYVTNDKRSWTQPAARNFGAKKARGEVLILTDIDHIISNKVVKLARKCPADVVRFKREAAVIDGNGEFTQDMNVLHKYGYIKNTLPISPHGNSYIIKKDLYLSLGGVDESYVGTGKYPNREEVPLKKKLKKLWEAGEITIIDDETKPTIYMIPNGRYCGEDDYNPFGLFHNLSRQRNIGRKTNKQKHRERLIRHNTSVSRNVPG